MSTSNIVKITIITILISSLMIFVGFNHEEKITPQTVYQVYLDGNKIGLIYDKNELYDLINKEGNALKEKYQVSQIYPPNGLKIEEYITYDEKVMSTNEIYNLIKEQRPFTIEGYKVTIKLKDTEDKSLYVLKEEDFKQALNQLIYAFVGKDKYESFINETQVEITETGSNLESIYFEETLTMKKTFISSEEKIFTSADELSQYLLFSTNEKQKTYVVKAGEDIESISAKHELNPEEFLIANPSFTSTNQLLSPGQLVNIGLIKPVFNLVYEEHVVEYQPSYFETEIEYDTSLSAGVRYVKQEGVNGIDRVTKKQIVKNGEIQEAFPVSQEEIKPSISKIIVRGNRTTTGYDDNSIWKWPTNRPYSITSYFNEYRNINGKRDIHKGLDISGKHGSPIYAIGNGVVTYSGWQGNGGYVINIDHGNGMFSEYAHMSKLYVSVGEVVTRGYTIGAMGKTGFATGTHLHLGIWNGKPFSSGAYAIDPLTKYK